ncbi:hypothetical protein ACHWQZ_G016467 [Mnemiopsis leidyi]
MARYTKIGSKVGSLRKWLPEVTTTLFCLLIVGTVLRAVSSTEKGHCDGLDKKGMIGWIAVIIALVLCVVEKWLRSRHIGATLVSLVIYFFIQISINDSPLKCIQEMFSDDTVKFIPIIQTVICVLFSFLYALILFSDRNTNTV